MQKQCESVACMDVSTLEPKVSHKQEKAYPSSHAETIILYPCSTQPVILGRIAETNWLTAGQRYAAEREVCGTKRAKTHNILRANTQRQDGIDFLHQNCGDKTAGGIGKHSTSWEHT